MSNPLQRLCIEIAQSGLQPSVSLIRAKSPHKVALPDAINTMQWWQQQDQKTLLAAHKPSKDEVKPTSSNQSEIGEMLSQIEKMESQLAAFKQQLLKFQHRSTDENAQ